MHSILAQGGQGCQIWGSKCVWINVWKCSGISLHISKQWKEKQLPCVIEVSVHNVKHNSVPITSFRLYWTYRVYLKQK